MKTIGEFPSIELLYTSSDLLQTHYKLTAFNCFSTDRFTLKCLSKCTESQNSSEYYLQAVDTDNSCTCAVKCLNGNSTILARSVQADTKTAFIKSVQLHAENFVYFQGKMPPTAVSFWSFKRVLNDHCFMSIVLQTLISALVKRRQFHTPGEISGSSNRHVNGQA